MLLFCIDPSLLLIIFYYCAVSATDVGKWTGEKLRELGSLVKGLDLDDIQKLSKEAFGKAVGVWGQYLDVDMVTLEALAEKAKEVSREFQCTLVFFVTIKWKHVFTFCKRISVSSNVAVLSSTLQTETYLNSPQSWPRG